jgi:hypothetical protein
VGALQGPEEKCRYVVEDLGCDPCTDYEAGNLQADLAGATPDCIDVYFENAGASRKARYAANTGSPSSAHSRERVRVSNRPGAMTSPSR